MPKNDQSTERLAELIAQRRERLTQLRDVGRRQSELIASGEISALLRLLSAKQQLIAALQTIETQLRPFHEQEPEQRQWESADARARAAAEAAQCAALLEEVMRIEQANEQQMIARRRDAAHRLKSINAAHRVRDAYGSCAVAGSTPQTPRLGDRDALAGAENRASSIDVST